MRRRASEVLPAAPTGRPATTAPPANTSGICRQQGRGHGAAGGQSGDEDAAGVRGEALHRRGDHLPDRQRFTLSAAGVHRTEPVEATPMIVRVRLFGQQQGNAQPVGERDPVRRRARSRRRPGRSRAAARSAAHPAWAVWSGTWTSIVSRPGLLPKPVTSTGTEEGRGAAGIGSGAIRGEAGSLARAVAMADAALMAVRTLRRAIRSSRDHFMTGEYS